MKAHVVFRNRIRTSLEALERRDVPSSSVVESGVQQTGEMASTAPSTDLELSDWLAQKTADLKSLNAAIDQRSQVIADIGGDPNQTPSTEPGNATLDELWQNTSSRLNDLQQAQNHIERAAILLQAARLQQEEAAAEVTRLSAGTNKLAELKAQQKAASQTLQGVQRDYDAASARARRLSGSLVAKSAAIRAKEKLSQERAHYQATMFALTPQIIAATRQSRLDARPLAKAQLALERSKTATAAAAADYHASAAMVLQAQFEALSALQTERAVLIRERDRVADDQAAIQIRQFELKLARFESRLAAAPDPVDDQDEVAVTISAFSIYIDHSTELRGLQLELGNLVSAIASDRYESRLTALFARSYRAEGFLQQRLEQMNLSADQLLKSLRFTTEDKTDPASVELGDDSREATVLSTPVRFNFAALEGQNTGTAFFEVAGLGRVQAQGNEGLQIINGTLGCWGRGDVSVAFVDGAQFVQSIALVDGSGGWVGATVTVTHNGESRNIEIAHGGSVFINQMADSIRVMPNRNGKYSISSVTLLSADANHPLRLPATPPAANWDEAANRVQALIDARENVYLSPSGITANTSFRVLAGNPNNRSFVLYQVRGSGRTYDIVNVGYVHTTGRVVPLPEEHYLSEPGGLILLPTGLSHLPNNIVVTVHETGGTGTRQFEVVTRVGATLDEVLPVNRVQMRADILLLRSRNASEGWGNYLFEVEDRANAVGIGAVNVLANLRNEGAVGGLIKVRFHVGANGDETDPVVKEMERYFAGLQGFSLSATVPMQGGTDRVGPKITMVMIAPDGTRFIVGRGTQLPQSADRRVAIVRDGVLQGFTYVSRQPDADETNRLERIAGRMERALGTHFQRTSRSADSETESIRSRYVATVENPVREIDETVRVAAVGLMDIQRVAALHLAARPAVPELTFSQAVQLAPQFERAASQLDSIQRQWKSDVVRLSGAGSTLPIRGIEPQLTEELLAEVERLVGTVPNEYAPIDTLLGWATTIGHEILEKTITASSRIMRDLSQDMLNITKSEASWNLRNLPHLKKLIGDVGRALTILDFMRSIYDHDATESVHSGIELMISLSSSAAAASLGVQYMLLRTNPILNCMLDEYFKGNQPVCRPRGTSGPVFHA